MVGHARHVHPSHIHAGHVHRGHVVGHRVRSDAMGRAIAVTNDQPAGTGHETSRDQGT